MGKNEPLKVSPYTAYYPRHMIFIWIVYFYFYSCSRLPQRRVFFRRRAISLGMLHSMRLNFLSWHYLPRLHPLALVFLACGKADAEMVSRVQGDPEGMEGSQEGGRQRTQGRG